MYLLNFKIQAKGEMNTWEIKKTMYIVTSKQPMA
jgi:hypothetical protein